MGVRQNQQRYCLMTFFFVFFCFCSEVKIADFGVTGQLKADETKKNTVRHQIYHISRCFKVFEIEKFTHKRLPGHRTLSHPRFSAAKRPVTIARPTFGHWASVACKCFHVVVYNPLCVCIHKSTVSEMAEMNPPYYNEHPMRVLLLIPKNPPPTLKEVRPLFMFNIFDKKNR